METQRMSALRQPAQLERLLEAFVSRGQQLQAGSHQIRDSHALPDSLQRLIAQTEKDGRVWTCWAYEARIVLFIAAMEFPLSRERGMPVLTVARYADGGALLESRKWVSDGEGRWVRYGE